jgi:hypothetical protein
MTYFDNLAYSKTYLCKGYSNKLLYLLSSQPNVIYFTDLDLSLLPNYITYDYTNYLIYYTPHLKIPNKFILDSYKRVFILFSIYENKDLDKNTKKDINSLVKKYQSEYYEILDLTKFTTKQDLFINSKKQHLTINNLQHYSVIDKIEDSLLDYPLSYIQFLDDFENNDLNLSLINSVNYLISEGIKTISNLKSYQWIVDIDTLPSRELESIFIYPMGGINSLLDKDIELTYSIFYWYKIYYKLYYNKFNIPIKPFIKIYFTWVYYSTIRYAKGLDKGLTISNSGYIKKYYFNPSIDAIKLLFTMNDFIKL